MRSKKITMIHQKFRLMLAGGFLGMVGVSAVPAWSVDIEPYGHIQMDAVYSSRGTNPLDPPQFNAYVTAADGNSTDTSSFSPRFSVLGLKATNKVDGKTVTGKVEMDFYGSNTGNPEPRLRLAFIDLKAGSGRFTVGQDWVPVASLNPSALDFSVMGYGGNLWQRIPQITYRQSFGDNLEGLVTTMRFARGQTISTPNSTSAFTDAVRMPYVGSRFAFKGWGKKDKGLLAVSGAWRQFKTTATIAGVNEDTTQHSFISAVEVVIPICNTLTFASEVGYGQAVGDEFFRFGQAFDGPNAVKTAVGFGELQYALNSDWSFAGGYGLDDPNNSDTSSTYTGYLKNQRAYFNVVRTLVESFKVGAEYTWINTEYAGNVENTGGQAMLSFWYGFWL